MSDVTPTNPPAKGWVLYDGECGFCSRWLGFWQPTLARHGFGIAALQEPWVTQQLQLPPEERLYDIRLLTREGESVSGANVYLQVTRRIWWAWPFYGVFSLPRFNWLIHLGYRWFARNRYCISHACRLHPAPGIRRDVSKP
jgi:predicted DCC family thiol-disulfide oxidoreductase YuxK